MTDSLLIYALLIFVAAMIGGLFPLWRKWSDELLHMFVSFGAGIFIGTVFLHLLPEALSSEHAHDAAPFILIGFLVVFFIEKFLFSLGENGSRNTHTVISVAAFLGLSVHSIIAGFGLAVGSRFEGLDSVLFYSIITHKTTAAFSLMSLFLLAQYNKKKCLLLLLLFSLMTPFGALVLGPVLPSHEGYLLHASIGLTAGTFLYVSVGELLPEVFHTSEKKWQKLILLLLGIFLISLMGNPH